MDPIILPILVIAAIGLFAGKKKKKKADDKNGLKPGPKRTKPTPRVPGTKDPGSDDLPDGTHDGHLPKGDDYGSIVPDDMTTADLWISPDCQAYLVGSEWFPLAEDPAEPTQLVDAYEWFLAQPELSYSDEAFAAVEAGAIDGGYEAGMFPDYSTLDLFALQVLMEASDECARTMPLWPHYDDFEHWEADYDAWAESYPVLSRLFALIKAEAATGEVYEDINIHQACYREPGEYLGFRNMENAWEDNMPADSVGCEEFVGGE